MYSAEILSVSSEVNFHYILLFTLVDTENVKQRSASCKKMINELSNKRKRVFLTGVEEIYFDT